MLSFTLERAVDLANAFGQVLRQKRKSAGLSQEKFAEICSLERTFISFLERGERRPSLNMTFVIATALGMKASDLVAEVEKQISE